MRRCSGEGGQGQGFRMAACASGNRPGRGACSRTGTLCAWPVNRPKQMKILLPPLLAVPAQVMTDFMLSAVRQLAAAPHGPRSRVAVVQFSNDVRVEQVGGAPRAGVPCLLCPVVAPPGLPRCRLSSSGHGLAQTRVQARVQEVLCCMMIFFGARARTPLPFSCARG